MRIDTNERAEVKEVRGVVAEDLRGALLEMEAVGAGARTAKPFYHGNINTRAEERLTDEQRMQAIDRLEEKLGLSGQPRVVVVHDKKDREHCHIVWSRIDLDRMAAVSDSHNYRKHEEVARDLEREFGHERVQGAHAERDGKPRPKRTPSHAEMLQSDRTGLSAKQVKEQITELWRATDSGQSFAVALWDHGFVLARGDRRDFVVIDPRGGTHSLARRVEGAKVKDIRERMSDLDPAQLYNIKDAKLIQRARQEREAQAANTNERPVPSARDEEKPSAERSGNGNMEWTDHAGMVAQQRSAMSWDKKLNRDSEREPRFGSSHEKDSTEQPSSRRERLRQSEKGQANNPATGHDRGRSR